MLQREPRMRAPTRVQGHVRFALRPLENQEGVMSKTDRLKQFVGVVFAEDISDLRTIPVKEALANIGLGLLMIIMAAFHTVLGFWQLVVAVLLVGYDAIAKGLTWLMESRRGKHEVKETGESHP